MVGLKLVGDNTIASLGARCVRQLTSSDRAHLVLEGEFGRDVATTIANSANADLPLGAYGSPTYTDPYGVTLYSPASGETGQWLDTQLGDLGGTFCIAVIFNPMNTTGFAALATNRVDANQQYGVVFEATGANVLSDIYTFTTASPATLNRRQLGNLLLSSGTTNAWRMAVLRVTCASGKADPTVKISQYQSNGLLGSILSATYTGDTLRDGLFAWALGSNRGSLPFTGATPKQVKHLAAFVWANQTTAFTDAQVLAMYQEQYTRFAALGVTI